MKKIIIAIDGYSSCGKSTLAKDLAAQLSYVFIDSGAMYRAITLYFLRQHFDWNDEQKIKALLQEIKLEFIYNPMTQKSEMHLNDENVEHIIRDMLVSENVSKIATLKDVRHFAVKQQQAMGKKKGIVMDGRDIGTTVFPHAELKLFVTADISVRVQRRFKELFEKNPNITMNIVLANSDKDWNLLNLVNNIGIAAVPKHLL